MDVTRSTSSGEILSTVRISRAAGTHVGQSGDFMMEVGLWQALMKTYPTERKFREAELIK